jgi:SnoaL-like domain
MPSAPASSSDRKAKLRSIADAYFNGLAAGDVSRVPYAEDVTLRTPLALGGEDSPIQGKAAVLAFFAGIYAAIGAVRIKEYYFNDALTSVCVNAEIDLRITGKTLHVADVFEVDVQGQVTAQHNHLDPRPAIA